MSRRFVSIRVGETSYPDPLTMSDKESETVSFHSKKKTAYEQRNTKDGFPEIVLDEDVRILSGVLECKGEKLTALHSRSGKTFCISKKTGNVKFETTTDCSPQKKPPKVKYQSNK